MTELLAATPEAIARAASLLKQGGLAAFPTETVYGLGANALDAQAVRKIFLAKGRPAADPLIVHISGVEGLPLAARSVSELSLRLAQAFWPGPLTLILPKHPAIPDEVTSGLDTVAARAPNHPVALALLKEAGLPIAAPSANRFGHVSPTTAQHVWNDLHGQIDLILDGGATHIGVESTVLDASVSPPRILRPGAVTREMLEEVVGHVVLLEQNRKPQPGLPSPGLLEKHYAPRTEMILFTGERAREALLDYLREQTARGRKIGALAKDEEAAELEQAGAIVYRLGEDLPAVARRMYDGLRWLDSQNAQTILCREFGRIGLGLAIYDRLKRAASRVIET